MRETDPGILVGEKHNPVGRYVHGPRDHSFRYSMRRDYFTLELADIGWVDDEGDPAVPTIMIDFIGPTDDITNRLTTSTGEYLSDSETDVALRLQSDIEKSDAMGVVSVTNRSTGEYIVELNETVSTVMEFIKAVRRYEEYDDSKNGRYRIKIAANGEDLVSYEKSTLLVYNHEGELLRRHSIIPSGIEL